MVRTLSYTQIKEKHLELLSKSTQTQLMNPKFRQKLHDDILILWDEVRKFIRYNLLTDPQTILLLKWRAYWFEWVRKHPEKAFVEGKV